MELTGVIAVATQCILVGVAAISVWRNKRSAANSRWRKRTEPAFLDSLEWIYNAQIAATKKGFRSHLPPLPDSIKDVYIEDDDPDWELEMLKREVSRRHDRP